MNKKPFGTKINFVLGCLKKMEKLVSHRSLLQLVTGIYIYIICLKLVHRS